MVDAPRRAHVNHTAQRIAAHSRRNVVSVGARPKRRGGSLNGAQRRADALSRAERAALNRAARGGSHNIPAKIYPLRTRVPTWSENSCNQPQSVVR